MNLVSRYIARQFGFAFLVCLVVLTLLAWMVGALREFNVMTAQGQSVLVFLAISSLALPALVVVVAPLAVFLAAVWLLQRLNAGSELVVLNAAGYSPSRLITPFAGITGLDQIMNLFFNDKVAMAWLGTWNAPVVRDTAKFSVTTTYFPPFTKDNSPYLSEPTIYRVGGPSSSGQFGISSGAADRGTLDAAVDFLKYISAPAQAQKIAAYDEGNLPVIKGVEPADVAKGFTKISQLPERGITDAVSRFNGEQYGTPHNRLLQSFMLGEISRDEMKQQYQALLDKAVQDQCDANNWDWCNQ